MLFFLALERRLVVADDIIEQGADRCTENSCRDADEHNACNGCGTTESSTATTTTETDIPVDLEWMVSGSDSNPASTFAERLGCSARRSRRTTTKGALSRQKTFRDLRSEFLQRHEDIS